MNKKLIIGIVIVAVTIGIYLIATTPNCAKAGEVATSDAGPDYSKQCCEGLIEVVPADAYNDECVVELIGSGTICTNCGNDICEEWESKCNCPEDCE